MKTDGVSKLRKIFLPYLRWRHSKGYGVHSPFAYRLVTDVVRPGNYGHYVYGRFPEEDLRLVARLVISLKAGRMSVIGVNEKRLKELGKRLNCRFETGSDAMSGPDELPVIAFDAPEQLRKELCRERERGLVFEGKRVIVSVPRREMAFVKYDMKF